MKGMTIKQIAAVANVTEKTVRSWIQKASVKLPQISGKTTEARRKGKPAAFTLEETIAIVRAGGNQTLADLLLQNARQTERQYRVNRLPNGKQLEELRRIYGNAEASTRIDFLLGYSKLEEYLNPEEARTQFQLLRKQLEEKSSGQPDLPGLNT